MDGWNYRVIKLLKENGDIQFDIREVYYDGLDNPALMSAESSYPYSYLDHRDSEETEKESKFTLLLDIRHYLESLKKPVLVYDEKLNHFTGDEMSLEYEFDCGDLFGS